MLDNGTFSDFHEHVDVPLRLHLSFGTCLLDCGIQCARAITTDTCSNIVELLLLLTRRQNGKLVVGHTPEEFILAVQTFSGNLLPILHKLELLCIFFKL